MSVAIRYFSKFGHSKLMAEAVSQVAGVPALDVNEPLDGEVEILFLGAGLFLGKVDGSVGAFIKTLSPEKVGKVVCFGSCAIKKSPVPELKKLLEAQGHPGLIAGPHISCGDLGHIVQQVHVCLVLVHKLEHKVHSFQRIHIGDELSQNPDAVGACPVEQQVVAAGTGKHYVD